MLKSNLKMHFQVQKSKYSYPIPHNCSQLGLSMHPWPFRPHFQIGKKYLPLKGGDCIMYTTEFLLTKSRNIRPPSFIYIYYRSKTIQGKSLRSATSFLSDLTQFTASVEASAQSKYINQVLSLSLALMSLWVTPKIGWHSQSDQLGVLFCFWRVDTSRIQIGLSHSWSDIR